MWPQAASDTQTMPGATAASASGPQAACRQRAGAVGLQEHVASGGQGAQLRHAGRVVQVQQRRTFAAAQVGDRPDVGQLGAVEHQHLGAPIGQQPRGHRAGQDAREVQHPQAVQRRGAAAVPAPGRGVADAGQGHQRLGGHGLGRGRGIPVVEAAQRAGHAAGRGHRGLEGLGRPAAQGLRDRLARGLRAGVAGPARPAHGRGGGRSWRAGAPSQAGRPSAPQG